MLFSKGNEDNKNKKNFLLKGLVVVIIILVISMITYPILKKIVIGLTNTAPVANILKLPIPVYGYKVGYKEAENFLGANADTEGYLVIPITVPEIEFTENLKVLKILNEGKKIKKGDVMALLAPHKLILEKDCSMQKKDDIIKQQIFIRTNYSEELERQNKTLAEKEDILKKISELYRGKFVSLPELEKAKDDVGNIQNYIYNLQKDFKEKMLSLETQKAALEKDLLKINKDLISLSIKSPIDGYITQKFVDEGAEILPKEKIIEVSMISPLKVLAHVSQIYLNKISLDSKVYIRFSESGKEHQGRISNINAVVEKKAQTFQVEILYENKEEKILPGTIAFVRFENASTKAFMIPKFAVVGMNDAPQVFVIKDNKAKACKVVLGEYYPFGLIEVKEGLQQGDIIIKSPLKYINDGTEVKILLIE
jgi:RND family efflux transporter MFP subunit